MSTTIPKLKGPDTWDAWYLALEIYAKSLHIWENVNPDAEDMEDDRLIKPILPSKEAITRELNRGMSTRSSASVDDEAAIKEALEEARKEYDRELKDYKLRMHPIDAVSTWITGSMDAVAQNQMKPEYADDDTLKMRVRKMQRVLAPSFEAASQDASYAYRAVLQQGRIRGQKAITWLERCEESYGKAVRYNLPDIQGTIAIDQFLSAIGAQFDHEWARQEQNEIISRRQQDLPPKYTIIQYARIFRDIIRSKERTAQINQAFATMNEGSTEPRKGQDCPCGRFHPWSANDCKFVRTALGVKGALYRPLSKIQKDKILKKLKESKWKDLKTSLMTTKSSEQNSPAQNNALVQENGKVVAMAIPGTAIPLIGQATL